MLHREHVEWPPWRKCALTIPDISARSIGRVAEHALVFVRRRPPVGRWGINRCAKLGGCMPAPARVVEHGARERDQICLTAGDDVLSLLGLCNKTDRDCNDTRAV